MLTFIRNNWEKGLFLVGMLIIAAGYGVAVGKYRLWPHDTLNRAADAFADWRANWRHYTHDRSMYLIPTEETAGGVKVNDQALAYPGYTFMTAYRDGRFGATLVDMDGKVVHKWDVAMAELFPTPPAHLKSVPPDWDINIQGSALLPNGDVILNIYSTGLVKLDRCGKPVWILPEETHHSVDVLPDGNILSPIRLEDMTAPMPSRRRIGMSETGTVVNDGVALISADGKVLRTTSMLDALHASGREGIFLAGSGNEARTSHGDPVHLNDVEMLRPEMAGAFPIFKAGDLLVSFRSTNTIAVLDGETWEMKWSMTGLFHGQHDPDFLPNGHIMVFDNDIFGDALNASRSKVLEIDPITQEIVWTYDGRDDVRFYASSRGMQVPLPNGNVLISDPFGGRIIEVSRSAGDKVVWEYVNLAEPGFVGMVLDVDRIDAAKLSFVGQSCN
ncbi:MAG: arylsulfotransferase family protein [Geminicoccaceae bacterium]